MALGCAHCTPDLLVHLFSSGNSPGIQGDASAAGKASRSGTRLLSETSTPQLGQRFLAEIIAAIEVIAASLIAGGKMALVLGDIPRKATRYRPDRAGIQRFQQCRVRHQPRDAAIAVKKRVYPHEAVMCRCRREDGLGLPEAPVDLLEAGEETRYSRRAKGDMAPEHDVTGAHNLELLGGP